MPSIVGNLREEYTDPLWMAKTIYARFGARIRELRKQHNWSQTYLSVHTGLSRTFISDLESGRKEPCLLSMIVLAKGFDLKLTELLDGIDDE